MQNTRPYLGSSIAFWKEMSFPKRRSEEFERVHTAFTRVKYHETPSLPMVLVCRVRSNPPNLAESTADADDYDQ